MAGVGIFVQNEHGGFYVSELLPGGAACLSGQIEIKDQLLKVGDHDVTGAPPKGEMRRLPLIPHKRLPTTFTNKEFVLISAFYSI